MEKVFETLKMIREVIDGSKEPEMIIGQHIELLREEWEKRRTAELLNRREDRCYRRALDVLNKYKNKVAEAGNADDRSAFEIMKQEFSMDRRALDILFDQAGNVLENTFDFMETAFLNSQEMVVFIADLNTDFYSIRFLQEYECERYYQYNKEMLFEDVSTEIRKRIEAL